MVGLIWLVQVVHYPLFRLVGSGDFKGYHHNHTRLISWVVGPPMLAEGLSAAVLAWYRPAAVPESAALAGFSVCLLPTTMFRLGRGILRVHLDSGVCNRYSPHLQLSTNVKSTLFKFRG